MVIGYIVVVEIWQQIDMRKNGANGIYLRIASKKDDGSIKPLGFFKNFTNKDRFNMYEYYEMGEQCQENTVTYSGLKRIGINAIAALTLARYGWSYSDAREYNF